MSAQAVAHTVCQNGHEDTVEAIDPMIVDGEVVVSFWPSAFDFCMVCDRAVISTDVEVRR